MALQRGQGCLPSKVCVTAWARESRHKLSASMEVHATDWKKAQCNPMEQASASTTINLANRGSTAECYEEGASAVKELRMEVVF
jgi:hypothetical protein